MILRLLIVDDDTSLCSNLRSFFERHQYKVETAHDGLDAVKVMEKFHPNLMFLDIGLPGQSGIEVLKQVKEKDPAVRVIMITGQTEDELMRQARVLGADDYVTKPFTLDYLSGEVLDKLHKQLFYELRSTTADLAIEHEKVELLFDQMKDGVIMFDAQGMIYVANPIARTLLGLSGEITSTNASVAFKGYKAEQLPPDFPVPFSFDDLAKLAGKPFDLLREQPKKLFLNVRINPIRSRKQDQLYGYLAVMRDVTQERRAETAMHRFISMISHKLRTPLVALRGYPPMLLSPNATSKLDDFQRKSIQTMLRECLRLETLVNELIAFSSLEPDELSKNAVALEDLVNEAVRILPAEYQVKKDQIQLDAATGKLLLQVDPTYMKHAFRNLIENAFKFGSPDLKIQATATNGHATIQFKDNGPGIPTEDRDRVFERFYQVDKDFVGQIPGAGLGLSVTKETIQAHGGKIWVESPNGSASGVAGASGKGATFFVELPTAK
jgi:two-component system sensor histidine kinase VicK